MKNSQAGLQAIVNRANGFVPAPPVKRITIKIVPPKHLVPKIEVPKWTDIPLAS